MIDHQSKLAFLIGLGLFVCGCAAHKGASPAPAATGTPSSPAAAKPAGAGVAAGAAANHADAHVVNQYVAAMRDDLSRGKIGIINDVMELSRDEAKVFWPVYQEYETELFELGDLRVEGIRQFARDERDGTLNDGEATRLATAYFDFEGKRLELLKKYHALIAEKLSPVRAAQFAQIEHRVGTVVDLLIASELPLITPAAWAPPAAKRAE